MFNPYPKSHTLGFLIGAHFYFASEGDDEQAVPFRVYQEISALLWMDILMMAVSIYPFPVCENGHRKKDLPNESPYSIIAKEDIHATERLWDEMDESSFPPCPTIQSDVGMLIHGRQHLLSEMDCHGTWVAFSKLLRVTTIKKSRWSGRIPKDGAKGI